MNIADLLPTVRKLTLSQKLALVEELTSDLRATVEAPDVKVATWDLSASSIARRNADILALLDKWELEGDEREQTETWEFLQQALDEDRLSSERTFFPK